MKVKLNASTDRAASGVTESDRLAALYSQHFTAQPSAVQTAQASGHFKIFSALDYSVPISYSNGSQKLSIR